METQNKAMPFPEKSLKILLAEDNAINRTIIETILKKKEYSVTSVENGKEVLHSLEREYFDLILMDANMPLMDGFEATREIRKQEKTIGEHIPIIALTASIMKEDKERCIEAGMDAFLSKPINTEELWHTISKVVRENTNWTDSDICINLTKAMETVEGDMELFQELIEDFLTLFPKQLSGIGEMIQKKDPQQLQKRAHSFKGAVANFGAERAYELAVKLEDLGRESRLEDALEVFEKLKQEMSHVRNYFVEHKWEEHVL